MYWQNAGSRVELKSRKNIPLMLFNSTFFLNLVYLKKHSLRLVVLELLVLRKPALRQYFFVVRNLITKQLQITVSRKEMNKTKFNFENLNK